MTTLNDTAAGVEMGVGPWSLKTKHGYPVDEVISALQKSVRRGDSDGALFWANEANQSGFGGWTWRRIFTITTEDVGLAEPNAPAVVWALYEMSVMLLAKVKKPAPGEKQVWPMLLLLQAVWYLTRLPKNREIADLCGVLDFREQLGEMPPVPDVAVDGHTVRGRAMGRGSVHFEDESTAGGRWCENEIEIDGNRYRKEFYSRWAIPSDPASRLYRPKGLSPLAEQIPTDDDRVPQG